MTYLLLAFGIGSLALVPIGGWTIGYGERRGQLVGVAIAATGVVSYGLFLYTLFQ